MPYLGIFDQTCLLWGIFGLEFWKNYCHICNQHLRVCLICLFTKLCKKKKKKSLNLGPKMPYLGIFDQKCDIWVLLCCNFKKLLSHLKTSSPWICLIAKCHDIMKMPKFGTKSALFGYFWARILKNYCHIWNQHPRITVIAKFCKKTNCLNLRPKMPYFGIFDQKCHSLVFLGKNFNFIVTFEISTFKFVYLQNFTRKQKCLNLGPKMPNRVFLDWNLKTILSYLKLAPPNLPNYKISRKNKNAKIWDQKCLIWVFLTKNAIFGYFWATILKELLSYLKSAPSNLFTCKISRQNKNA